MARWRRPTISQFNARVRVYKQWISDDIAEFMAWQYPLRSKLTRRAVRLMKKKVLDYMVENDETDKEEARMEVSIQLIVDVTSGQEEDWALRSIVSP